MFGAEMGIVMTVFYVVMAIVVFFSFLQKERDNLGDARDLLAGY